MKTAEVKNSTSTSQSSKPFFNKGGEDTFFAQKQDADAPFFQPKLIQTALAVGTPNDPFEQEADKVGRQVMDNFGQASSIQMKLSNLGVQTTLIQPMPIGMRISRMVQRRQDMVQQKCAECEEEEMVTQPKEKGIQFSGDGALVSHTIESRIQSQRGSGQSLDLTTKDAMESNFGADFSSVKIHTGTPAVQMSQELNAHAFTVGNDIFFNKDRYRPQTKEGRGLLAHELTHTVQQGAAVQNKRINRRPLSQMLEKHGMAHLSAMDESTLRRKKITQLQNLPEEGMMQQKEIFESNEVDKVQMKDSGLRLRRCSSTPTGKQYDPGTPIGVGYSVPLVKSNIEASPGEQLIFGTANVADQDKERTGTGAWNTITGTGPYETEFSVAGDADFDSSGSGSATKKISSLNSGNVFLFIKNSWTGVNPITVTAKLRDKAAPATAPDTGTTKDPDVTITWTIKKRQKPCPTGLRKVSGPGATWASAPAVYTYKATPDLPPSGSPDYENQTILESFGPATAVGFTMSDVKTAWKTANPTINTPDKVANFLWGTTTNGTFVFDSNDLIADEHSGFGGSIDPLEPSAYTGANSIGNKKTQTYTCAGNSVGTATIERKYNAASGIKIKKTGP